MHRHADLATPGLLALTAMWFAMMTAMMAPVAWPWVVAFQRFRGSTEDTEDTERAPAPAGRRRLRGLASTVSFVGGYAAAWMAYSIAAAALQRALMMGGALNPAHPWSTTLSAVTLIGAGVYQFAPLKRVCLAHCRNPITYFLTRWRSGSTAGFRLGLGHGIFCVGCCWALMATALVVGMSNLWWMTALTAVAFVEQVIPHGARIRVPLGITLIAAGLLRA